MEDVEQLLYDTKQLMSFRYPRFASEIAAANISFRRDLKYHTAATDGQNIYFDPDYFTGLNEEDRLFLIAHELLHIKFAHIFRLKDKNGQKRDMDVWNEATDAIINANLERDGFTIKEGYVNRPEALKYSAEEFYQILLEEKKELELKQGQGQSTEENGSPEDMSENQEKHMGDDHSLWEEAFEKRKKGKDSKEDSNSTKNAGQGMDDCGGEELDDFEKKGMDDFEEQDIDERKEFSSNREERLARAKEKLEKMKENILSDPYFSEKTNLGSVGESADEFDWRLLLRREIEKTETIWSQRRSIAENNFAYRLEENDVEDEAETEAMIDVSGSVDLDLVRAFLRMLKPLLRQSKLRVGCFNERYWGMTEIKKVSDIDNFEIPKEARGSSARTEDWDLAVRSFTKKREINKIVFTDGIPGPGNMPKADLKNENVIWLVYGNKKFNPCCGKVIQITPRQLAKLNNCQVSDASSSKVI